MKLGRVDIPLSDVPRLGRRRFPQPHRLPPRLHRAGPGHAGARRRAAERGAPAQRAALRADVCQVTGRDRRAAAPPDRAARAAEPGARAGRAGLGRAAGAAVRRDRFRRRDQGAACGRDGGLRPPVRGRREPVRGGGQQCLRGRVRLPRREPGRAAAGAARTRRDGAGRRAPRARELEAGRHGAALARARGGAGCAARAARRVRRRCDRHHHAAAPCQAAAGLPRLGLARGAVPVGEHGRRAGLPTPHHRVHPPAGGGVPRGAVPSWRPAMAAGRPRAHRSAARPAGP